MHDKPTSVGVDSRAQNGEAPFTSGMVNRAKSETTKSILKHAKSALLAIVLTPSYQATLATGAAIGLVLLGAVK